MVEPAGVKPITTYKPGENVQQAFGLTIYGQGGTGKTTLIGTMPGRGLIIDVPQIEGGTFVLSDKADRIEVTSIETWDAIDNVYWFLKKGQHNYQWVAIDSITAMQELAKRKTVAERDLSADPHKLTLPEYGKIGQLVGELVYRFRTLPLHTIWIAQERKFGADEDSAGMIGPDVLPSALAALKPSMLLVGRLSVEHTLEGGWERQLRIGPHPRFHTKCRARPGLDVPAAIRNPDLTRLLKYLLGSGERPEEVQDIATMLLAPAAVV